MKGKCENLELFDPFGILFRIQSNHQFAVVLIPACPLAASGAGAWCGRGMHQSCQPLPRYYTDVMGDGHHVTREHAADDGADAGQKVEEGAERALHENSNSI